MVCKLDVGSGETVNLPSKLNSATPTHLSLENDTEHVLVVETEENLDGREPRILIKLKKQPLKIDSRDRLEPYRPIFY